MRTPAYWQDQAARAKTAAQSLQRYPELQDAWTRVAVGFETLADRYERLSDAPDAEQVGSED